MRVCSALADILQLDDSSGYGQPLISFFGYILTHFPVNFFKVAAFRTSVSYSLTFSIFKTVYTLKYHIS